jgi:hypothetical protein
MNLWNRILVAAIRSWACSVTLGLIFAIVLSENHSPRDLLLPGVVPATLIGSTIVAIAMTPVAIWSVRTGQGTCGSTSRFSGSHWPPTLFW